MAALEPRYAWNDPAHPLQNAHGKVIPQPIPLGGVSGLVFSNACYVLGWSILNLSSTAFAAFSLWNGSDPDGYVADPVTLAPNESNREWWGPDGVFYAMGVWFNFDLGTLSGTVRIALPKVEDL